MSRFRPVVLCGGSGKRLWPISRQCFPKQFSNLMSNEETMIQASLRRLVQAGGVAPLLVSGNCYRFLIGEQLQFMGVEGFRLIIEPEGRNTAPAICAAALLASLEDPKTVLVVTPSDQHIQDDRCYIRAINNAVAHAEKGEIVTLGIVPDRAETGYGYMEVGQDIKSGCAVDFVKFTEKPDLAAASDMIETEHYLWNSGIFVVTAEIALKAFEVHAPEVYQTVTRAVKTGSQDLDFFRLSKDFSEAPDISFDHAVMEYVEGKVVPLECGWNDLGSWSTVRMESPKDNLGNVIQGSVTAIGCENSYIRSDSPKAHVVTIGLDHIAVVATPDAVLVTDLYSSQAVSHAVIEMRNKGISQADGFPRASRPWGWYETLTKRPRFQVKSIVVKPRQKLSLQSHVHRAEHWVVVEGTAKVTIGHTEKIVTENESVFIPLGELHRLENPGHVDLHIIEVQTGSYLEEDDIVRYEDIYDRV